MLNTQDAPRENRRGGRGRGFNPRNQNARGKSNGQQQMQSSQTPMRRGAAPSRGRGRQQGQTEEQLSQSHRNKTWVRPNSPNPKASPGMTASLDNQRHGFMTPEERAVRFGSTNKSLLYDQLKRNRIAERANAIKNGFIPDPNKPTKLADAIDFRGTCQLMCPEFERVEREVQNGLDVLELDENGNVDENKAVKAYRRSAAGNDQPLPSDVRPPDVLERTLDYLMDSVLSSYPLIKCHAFLRDRTRSIRQDFTLQNIRDVSAVRVHERIARFHILCLHEMSQYDEDKFSEQQEMEQLRKVLLSLMEFYDDLREEGINTENEAEFRAYYIITHIHDHDIARQAQQLPRHVFFHAYMQRALEFYGLSQRNNEIMQTSSRRNKFPNIEASQNFYSRIFKLVADPSTPFLMACLLETHFADIRKGALKAMNMAYNFQHHGVDVETLCQVLGYDTPEQLLTEAELYGCVIDQSSGQTTIRFGQKHYRTKGYVFREPLSNPKLLKSMRLVDPKKAGRTFRQIINAEEQDKVYVRDRTPLPPVVGQSGTLPQGQQTVSPPTAGNLHNQTPVFSSVRPLPSSAHLVDNAAKAAELAAAANAMEMEKAALQKKIEEATLRKQREQQAYEEKRKQEMALAAQKAAEAEQKRQEQVELHARIRQQMEEARKAREASEARQRQAAFLDELATSWANQIVESFVAEEAKIAAMRTQKMRKWLKGRMRPWVERARSGVSKRKLYLTHRNNLYAFVRQLTIRSNQPIQQEKIKDAKQAVAESLQAEGRCLRKRKPDDGEQATLWKTEDYGPFLRKHLRCLPEPVHPSLKPGWQLWVNVENDELDSTKWFKSKFGLDDVFNRRVSYFKDINITVRSVHAGSIIPSQAANELGAVLFGLSELRVTGTDDINDARYWETERRRLEGFTQRIAAHKPYTSVPFVFAYWPRTQMLVETIGKIPELLALDNNPVVMSYHILIMNPHTIHLRLEEELIWLAKSSTSAIKPE